MSWIKDVKNEITALDVSGKSVRKFGVVIGGIFILIGVFLIWKNYWPKTQIVLTVLGILLLVGGLFRSKGAEFILIYKLWMGSAFALGWIVSRFILLILFYLVLFPVGIVAKIFHKEFLDIKFRDHQDSYWIRREKRLIDYEKMY